MYDNSLKANKGMRLNIELGGQLNIKLGEKGHSFKASLIGIEPQTYLILKIALPREFQGHLHKDKKLNIKYFSLGSEYGFSANIINNINDPFKLTFVSYPIEVKNLDTRSKMRVCCHIPSTINLNKKNIKGTITDISTNGCRFVVKLPVNLQPRQVMLIDNIQFSFPIMGLKGLQTFHGNVKNTTIDKEKIAMGIAFTNLGSEITSSISDYIANVSVINSVGILKI